MVAAQCLVDVSCFKCFRGRVSAASLPIPGTAPAALFRQALSERGLLWAVGLSRRQNVYFADVALIFPVANAGGPRKYNIPDQLPINSRSLPKRCWLEGNGEGLAGGARKVG